ncbi:MAG: hypothetical protein ACR2MW_03445 [Chthoniobacterales bacterium]
MEPAISGQDLFFPCDRCATALVVDRAAAGMMLTCQHCGQPITVPTLETSPILSPEREAELRRSLKENESQRTEITGYINQLNIQLHRWQLRLQTLDARNGELKIELASLASAPASTPSP